MHYYARRRTDHVHNVHTNSISPYIFRFYCCSRIIPHRFRWQVLKLRVRCAADACLQGPTLMRFFLQPISSFSLRVFSPLFCRRKNGRVYSALIIKYKVSIFYRIYYILLYVAVSLM